MIQAGKLATIGACSHMWIPVNPSTIADLVGVLYCDFSGWGAADIFHLAAVHSGSIVHICVLCHGVLCQSCIA